LSGPSQPELDPEVRAILDERAERVRARPVLVQEEALRWVAEFPVGGHQYAMPLEQLRASVPLKMVTAVPLSPPHVVGILRFQGAILPVLSLASLLGSTGWRADPAVLLVVEAGGEELVAFDCEQVPEARALPARLIEQATQDPQTGLSQIVTPELQQLMLIDVAKLLQRAESKAS
jgi:chemotaxis signal transduction protein